MAVQSNPDQLVGILRDTVVALVRRDGPDLSARQLGVFLTVYLTDGPHTVRGLAAELNVSKPAITRALDRLGELDLARRKVDPMDRRSVIVQRTLKGTAFLRDMRQIMVEAEAVVREMPPPVEAANAGAGARRGPQGRLTGHPGRGSVRRAPKSTRFRERPPRPGAPHVLHHLRRGAGRDGDARRVRRHHHARVRPERMVGRQRLRLEHVERGAGDLPAVQRRQQVLLHHMAAAGAR